MIFFVNRLLHRYGVTHIRSHEDSYNCCVQFYLLLLTVRPGLYFRWLQLQHRAGLTGICFTAVFQPEAHSMKHPSCSSIWIQSRRAELFVERWLAVVEKVRKMITKSGKFWEIYSKLQVTMEWMTVNLYILPWFYSAAYRCNLQVIPTVPCCGVSRSDVICLFVCRDTLMWTTADISCLIDIKTKFFNGKVVWWCLS